MVRWGIIVGNVVLLVGIGIFILANRTASQTVRTSTVNSLSTTSQSVINPLDELSADQIAFQAAQMTKLAELTMVRNRADSSATLLAVVPSGSSALAKPQIVTTAQKSYLDIIQHEVQSGDTVPRLANRYHVSGDSIRWSNDLTGDSLTVGNRLYIPPGEGIVYAVQATDTIDSIVDYFQANRNTFITVNDAESGSLPAGRLVWIPNAVQPTVATFEPAAFFSSSSTSYSFSGDAHDNGYAYGWCTWWVAHRRAQVGNPVPLNWGDAYSWWYASPSSLHSFKPRAGAIFWVPGANHVGFVEEVRANGDVYISEMNKVGWNVVSRGVIPASQVGSYYYIY